MFTLEYLEVNKTLPKILKNHKKKVKPRVIQKLLKKKSNVVHLSSESVSNKNDNSYSETVGNNSNYCSNYF